MTTAEPDAHVSNPYLNPGIARWLDSSEGLPPWPTAVESPAERSTRGRLRRFLNDRFAWLGAILPGLGLAGALGYALAGPRHYGGHTVPDSWMGDGKRDLTAADVERAIALYRIAGLLIVVVLVLLAWLFT